MVDAVSLQQRYASGTLRDTADATLRDRISQPVAPTATL